MHSWKFPPDADLIPRDRQANWPKVYVMLHVTIGKTYQLVWRPLQSKTCILLGDDWSSYCVCVCGGGFLAPLTQRAEMSCVGHFCSYLSWSCVSILSLWLKHWRKMFLMSGIPPWEVISFMKWTTGHPLWVGGIFLISPTSVSGQLAKSPHTEIDWPLLNAPGSCARSLAGEGLGLKFGITPTGTGREDPYLGFQAQSWHKQWQNLRQAFWRTCVGMPLCICVWGVCVCVVGSQRFLEWHRLTSTCVPAALRSRPSSLGGDAKDNQFPEALVLCLHPEALSQAIQIFGGLIQFLWLWFSFCLPSDGWG